MDEFGQYIQDAENNFIMLTEQQIAALKESNMLIEWWLSYYWSNNIL